MMAPAMISDLLPIARPPRRQDLATLPTPVEYAAGLSQRCGTAIWIKRDDLTSTVYGGNKVRKLEYLLGRVQERGAKRIVTVGGVGSNHVLATAIHAATLGIEAHAVVHPQPVSALVLSNVACGQALGVHYHAVASRLTLGPRALFVATRLRDVALIGPGGSSPLGNLGYVAAGFELARQIEGGELPTPRAIYLPLGSGGTACGLAVGLGAAGVETEICAVRVVESALLNRLSLGALYLQTVLLWRRLGGSKPRKTVALRLIAGYEGPGYGVATHAAQLAVDLASRHGLTLETTYSGKALAALTDRCRKGERGPFLFWNTFNSAKLLATEIDRNALPDDLMAMLDRSAPEDG